MGLGLIDATIGSIMRELTNLDDGMTRAVDDNSVCIECNPYYRKHNSFMLQISEPRNTRG